MTESSNNPKLATIRALLAKAEATEYQAEAEALRDRAFSMMAAYGVTEALLNDLRPEGAKERPAVRLIEVLPGAYQMPRMRFLQKIMSAMGCENVYYTKAKKPRARRRSAWEMRYAQPEPKAVVKAPPAEPVALRVECVGFPSDLDRAEMLWTSLCLQMFTMLLDDHEMRWMNRGEKRSFNNGRVQGYIEEVARRVRQREDAAKRNAQAEAPAGVSTALVLATRVDQVAALWAERHDPADFTWSSSSFGQNNDDGERAGRRAGSRANLGGVGLGRANQGELGR